MVLGDRFAGQLYYLETMDLFCIIDRNAKPDAKDLVAVKRLPTGQIVVERYSGQACFGVVRALKPYQLRRPEGPNREVRTCPG
jgi:hypothetical protein